MAASRFVEVTDKEIGEIKINSVPKKHTKDLCKNTTKQLFASGSVIIEYRGPCSIRLCKLSYCIYDTT